MNSLKRSNSDPNHKESFAPGDDHRFEDAERHRCYVIAARENLESAKKAFQSQRSATKLAVQAAEAAKLWLEQLEGGWGAPIAWVGPATLYEFWLQIPGYDGPVRGFSASTSQTGQIQHVSHVSSKTTSGAGCATLGCLAGGPLGALLGATMGKKNDVSTDVDVIDNRRFEIQVIGPGVAWSYVGNYSIEDSVRTFRDLLLSRSTNMDDPKDLAIPQREVVQVKNRSVDLEYMKLQDAEDLRKQAQVFYESAWSDYENVRLPIRDDLIARWKRSTPLVKSLIVVFGPVLAAGWIASIVYSIVAQPMPYRAIGGLIVLLQIFVIAAFVVYYRVEVRLIKTLPSESPTLQSLFSFIGRFKKSTPAQSNACPKCGNEVVAGAKFCVFCSAPINSVVYANSSTTSPNASAIYQPESRRISPLLGVGIFLMPYIFAWFTLAKGYGKTARAAALGWMGFFILVNAIALSSTPSTTRLSNIDSKITTASTPATASTNAAKTSPVPAPTVDEEVIKERVRRGEQVFKRIQGSTGLPLMFGWQAKDITLMVPTKEWNRLSTTQKVDLTYFMDTLAKAIRNSPEPYVSRWSAYYRRTEQLEKGREFDGLYREGYLSKARSICSSCWSITTGTLKKDGFYDEDYPVKGSTVDSFRMSLDNAK